jgi:Carboxypeptidase regulatory-like domain
VNFDIFSHSNLVTALVWLATWTICSQPNFSVLGVLTAQISVRTSTVQEEAELSSIQGEVVTENGRPLVGAVVLLRHLSDRGYRTTVTDQDGKFVATELAKGRYRIAVSASGYVSFQESLNVKPSTSPVRITLFKGGVVTGRVTNSNGQPIVGARVRAIRVKEAESRQTANLSAPIERPTDDRGIYRLYGLPPGTYLIAAGGSSQAGSRANAYDYDTPVFYPSTSIENATPIDVGLAAETGGVDITYRTEGGKVISGQIVKGLSLKPVSVFFTLQPVGLSAAISITSKLMDSKNNSFAIYGVPEGEYDLVMRASGDAVNAVGIHRVSVKGRGIRGVNASLTELSSASGHVSLSSVASCKQRKEIAPEMVTIDVERQGSPDEKRQLVPFLSNRFQVGLNAKREFGLTGLMKGRYKFQILLESDSWYVKSIVLQPGINEPKSVEKRATTDVGNHGLMVIPPGTLKPVNINLSDGAGSVQGRVALGDFPGRTVHIFIVPTASKFKEEVLRYSETVADDQGNFILKNLAPGSYSLFAQVVPGGDADSQTANALDPNVRAKLRLLSESNGKLVEIKPCQQLTGLELPILRKE